MFKKIDVTEIKGFRIGNAENQEAGTGCTVIICEEGATAGVDVRGGGPATRETDLLQSEKTVQQINAVVLSGGSAFGLEAGSGVMRELESKGVGFAMGDTHIPIVSQASLYDLGVGRSDIRPDRAMGIKAVKNAYDGVFQKGNHGAGTGATVGKMYGMSRAMKTGLGEYAVTDGLLEVGAIAAVNAFGDVFNGRSRILAGLTSADGERIEGTNRTLMKNVTIGAKPTVSTASSMYMLKKGKASQVVINDGQLELNDDDIDNVTSTEPEIPAEQVAESTDGIIDEYLNEPAPATETETVEELVADSEVIDKYMNEIAHTVEVQDYSEEAGVIDEYLTGSDEDTPESAEPVIEEAAAVEETVTEPAVEEAAAVEESVAEPVVEEAAPVEESVAEPVVEEAAPVEEIVAEPVVEEAAPVASVEPVAEEVSGEIPAEAVHLSDAKQEIIDNLKDLDAEDAEFTEILNSVLDSIVDDDNKTPAPLTYDEMGYKITFNTTLACLVTNAKLTKADCNRLASILHDGYARSIKPVHCTLDGDAIFVMTTNEVEVNFDAFAALATDIMQYTVIDAALSADDAYGMHSASYFINKEN